MEEVNDPTGEGMYGAYKGTQYNGDSQCKSCGNRIGPVESLLNRELCPSCQREKKHSRVKGGMA